MSVAAPWAHQSSAPFQRRRYVLSGFSVPPGLLEHGLRQFIVQQMTGRPITGAVNRARLDEVGQCIIIVATAPPEVLDSMEVQVLGSDYWSDWQMTHCDPRFSMSTNRGFNIIQSLYGSICGPNSDPQHDNKSEKASSGKRSDKS